MITTNDTTESDRADHVAIPDFIHRIDALWASYVSTTTFPTSTTIVLDLAELTGARPSPTVVLQLQHGPIGVAQVLRTLMLRVAEATLVSPAVRLIGTLQFWTGTQIEPATSFRPLLFWDRLVATFGDDPDGKLHRMSGEYLQRHLRHQGAAWVAPLKSGAVGELLRVNSADLARCRSLVVAASNFAAKHVSTDPRSPTVQAIEQAACVFARELTDPRELASPPLSALAFEVSPTRLRVTVGAANLGNWSDYVSPAEAVGPNH